MQRSGDTRGHNSGEETVNQPQEDMIHVGGGTVTLNCRYKISSELSDLYWHIHRPNDFPTYLLRRDRSEYGDNGTEFNERFHFNLNYTSSSVPLAKYSPPSLKPVLIMPTCQR